MSIDKSAIKISKYKAYYIQTSFLALITVNFVQAA